MALSEYKSPSVVSGKSVDDIARMDPDEFDSMSESDVRKIVGRLVSAGNKRMRGFERKGIESPAYNEAVASGGKFSTKGKDIEGLKEEFARARAFIKSPTSTVKQWGKIKKEVEKEVRTEAEKYGGPIKDTEKLSFDVKWKAFEKLKKQDHRFAEKRMKYTALDIIQNNIDTMVINGEDPRMLLSSDYIRSIERDSWEVYEEQESLNNEFDNAVSGFFTSTT